MKLAEGTFAGLHESEVALFRQHLKGMKGVGVEIGCCDGYSSAVILDASELHLTSIDPFIPDSMEASLIGMPNRYMENVSPYPNRHRLLATFSDQALVMWGGTVKECPNYSFLFIDGDHTYEQVDRDFANWATMLPVGGILAIHDARMGRPGGAKYHPGPSQVAQERIFSKPEEWEVIGEAHSLVIARKR